MTEPGNPLLEPSSLPYGLPSFADICVADLLPALKKAVADNLREIAEIASCELPPTAENTVVALELSGLALHLTSAYHYALLASDGTAEREQVEREVAPLLADHRSSIYLNTALFARIQTVFDQLESGQLESSQPSDGELVTGDLDERGIAAETALLIRRTRRDFVRAGAAATPQQRARIAEIDTRLASLATEFSENLMASTRSRAVHLTRPSEVEGICESDREAFASAAQQRGLQGWLITLDLPSVQAVLADIADPQVRHRVYEQSVARGSEDGADNSAVLLEIVRLRAERAELLGYPSHAAYVLEIETAQTPERAQALLRQVSDAAVTNAKHEAKVLTDGADDSMQPADWPYAAQRYRAEHFAVDPEEVRPYFELESVVWKGVFGAATAMFGLEFVERTDLSGFADDVRVIEVFDHDGRGIGLLLLDYFTRETKRGGAWMTSLRDQSRAWGTSPVVLNVLNLTRAPDGTPVLLTSDEVTTLFHECGHALHGLLSDVYYPSFSGTNVPRDVVEFPSQLNEMWASDTEFVTTFARHWRTGDSIDPQLLNRVAEANKVGQGFATTEYLAAATIDLAWHELSLAQAVSITDIDAFEKEVLEQAGLLTPGIAPRYRSRYFQHIFAGGYSAAYYSYFWAEVLDAAAAQWLGNSNESLRHNCQRYRDVVLRRGGTIEISRAFPELTGSEASTEPLLRRHGLSGAEVGSSPHD